MFEKDHKEHERDSEGAQCETPKPLREVGTTRGRGSGLYLTGILFESDDHSCGRREHSQRGLWGGDPDKIDFS